MSAGAFCVSCGRETTELSERALCRDCFAAKTPVVRLPEHVDVEICVHCASRRRGEVWLTGPGERLPAPRDEPPAWLRRLAEETAIERGEVLSGLHKPSVGARATPQDARNWEVELEVAGRTEGFDLTGSARTVVRIKGATCLRCSRRQGGYYESLVQIRARNRDLGADEIRQARITAGRVVRRVIETGDPMAFVLKDEEIEGGLDLYLGTTNAGRMVAKALSQDMGGRVAEHPKLVGQKDGLDVFRVTFSVRVPEYRRGDIVVFEEATWLVSTIGPKIVTLRMLGEGSMRSVERDDLRGVTVLRKEDAREAVVVSRSPGEMQVLDPWTYATVTVLAPDAASGASVRVLRWEGELLLLPPEAPTPPDDGGANR